MSIFIRQNFAVYLVYFQIGGLYHLYMFWSRYEFFSVLLLSFCQLLYFQKNEYARLR